MCATMLNNTYVVVLTVTTNVVLFDHYVAVNVQIDAARYG